MAASIPVMSKKWCSEKKWLNQLVSRLNDVVDQFTTIPFLSKLLQHNWRFML